ncbi:MetQ/NlpA family ABC transporter substrate-binding protein [Aulosira sp. FACHB-615]|uniref:MetQ/NlpA family ABC transporter substrate-binding protein n=1 Tax=Aulosira sp. FACHB-615 TaxID=2692777 RepID=UPI0016850EDC|nr:MetQ/NlpA family ABC transporter substrate-binding protein [Aulosira sp. FACHB-615]MBD2492040.1 NLPA lipoprotein [Aulosira sp. FACHB-615]
MASLTRINRRYFLLGIGSTIASVSFAGCTPKQPASTSQLVSQSTKTTLLKVGSRNTTTEDVLKFIQKEIAPSHGLDFQIVTIADSVKINDALKNGEIDANFFQHEPFMKQAAKRLNADFVMLNRSYTTITGLYSKKLKTKSLKDIPTGATIAISNDDSNQDRALKFLKQINLINLKEKTGEYYSVKDVIKHPKNLQIQELDNYAIVRALDDVDLAVTSASFLVQAKVSLDPIVLDEIGMANKNYAVGLATVQSKVNDPNIQKLNQLVIDPKLKTYINNYLKGTIAPAF